MTEEDIKEEWKTNRDKSREPRGRASYCRCDQNMISSGSKCDVCGRREWHKRDKHRSN